MGNYPQTFVGLPGPAVSCSTLFGIPPKQVPRLASEDSAELFQDTRTVHLRPIVVEPQQRRVGNTGFLPRPAEGPLLSSEDVSQLADDHTQRLAHSARLCHVYLIYRTLFTCLIFRSRLRAVVGGVRLRGGQPLYFQWEPDTEGRKLELQAHGDAGRGGAGRVTAMPSRGGYSLAA